MTTATETQTTATAPTYEDVQKMFHDLANLAMLAHKLSKAAREADDKPIRFPLDQMGGALSLAFDASYAALEIMRNRRYPCEG
jgi:hypothetical protein